MELGLKDKQHQSLANPIFDKSKGNRLPADDLYKFGEVGDVIRIFYKGHYLNAPVVKLEDNFRYIDIGDILIVQEWDSKRWKKSRIEDKDVGEDRL